MLTEGAKMDLVISLGVTYLTSLIFGHKSQFCSTKLNLQVFILCRFAKKDSFLPLVSLIFFYVIYHTDICCEFKCFLSRMVRQLVPELFEHLLVAGASRKVKRNSPVSVTSV